MKIIKERVQGPDRVRGRDGAKKRHEQSWGRGTNPGERSQRVRIPLPVLDSLMKIQRSA